MKFRAGQIIHSKAESGYIGRIINADEKGIIIDWFHANGEPFSLNAHYDEDTLQGSFDNGFCYCDPIDTLIDAVAAPRVTS